ncbi:MAG: DUF5060 domain-containing protein [Mangrovibacterium sp.]
MTQTWLIIFVSLFLNSCESGTNQQIEIRGELKKWHKITLLVSGPETSEFAKENPFLDYRLMVTFTNGDQTYIVPGFYCTDGNAAESSAEEGNKWMVRFRPDKIGHWSYSVSFRKGKDIAINEDPDAGDGIGADGLDGSFTVTDSDKKVPDLRGSGRVEYVGGRYLKFNGSDSFFLKNGADSPENFLAFIDFDQTYRYETNKKERKGEANPQEECHQYLPHVPDWKPGDPVWKDGKGKGIIGAVNYLASKGINSVYMLTMNIQGDGKDVWPWIDHNERYRFDCSKLDQWEIVFDHMEKLGIMLHLVTQETENECLLDIGYTSVQRKLYYRELVARFGHHLAVTWNLGEENGPAHWTPVGQTDQQRKDMATYLKKVNPYPAFNVLHTHSDNAKQDEYLTPLLGFEDLDGISLQNHNITTIHSRINKFIQTSSQTGKQWVVNLDEIGPANRGVMPDEFDLRHDTIRHYALWGSLMAGAGGAEWYFGYQYPHNDLACENFRSRDHWWDQTRIATDFFNRYLPFSEMISDDRATDNEAAFCLAKKEEIYAVYLPDGSRPTRINLMNSGKTFSVRWYDPRNGGDLQKGSVLSVVATGKKDMGFPPFDQHQDWVVLVQKTE